MYITLELLLSIIPFITPTTETVRDLCDVVYRTTGTPVLCQPHRYSAPVLDAEVCCAGKSCFRATAGQGCEDGESRYYCELGEVRSTGEVSCFFEVPDFCEAFSCPQGYQAPPLETYMCCNNGVCWTILSGSNGCELGDIYWCYSGVTNEDGTVTCFD